MILFFDTETNELHNPRVVQLAWILAEHDGSSVAMEAEIVRPRGFVISAESTAIHGIEHRYAETHGELPEQVMASFASAAGRAEVLVAHNISFDLKAMRSDLRAVGIDPDGVFGNKKLICTMKASTEFCRLPHTGGKGFFDGSYKWPKLEELYGILFEKTLPGAHDAAVDVEATMMCFFELQKLGVIQPVASGGIRART